MLCFLYPNELLLFILSNSYNALILSLMLLIDCTCRGIGDYIHLSIMHLFCHSLLYIFQCRYFSVLLIPLALNLRSNLTEQDSISPENFVVISFRFLAALLQLHLILVFWLSATKTFPITVLTISCPFPFSLLLISNFWYHSSTAYIWFCTLTNHTSIPLQSAGLPASWKLLP